MADLEYELKTEGFSIKHNSITHRMEFEYPKEYLEKYHDNWETCLPIHLHDVLQDTYSGTTQQNISDYLIAIASKHAYNPVRDRIEQTKWDGTDYLAQYCDTILCLPHDEESDFSRVLVRKWLCQTLALALYNGEMDDKGRCKTFDTAGVLVLQCGQGMGKTTLAKHLAFNDNGIYKTGVFIDSKKIDTIIMATGTWICELGELEQTMTKNEAGYLKAFITRELDEYRLPYGKNYPQTPRHTSFLATCNPEQFLNDPTGSRRYWVVPLKKIDLYASERFDYGQLWAQIHEIVKDYHSGNVDIALPDGTTKHSNIGDAFHLTYQEQQTLEARNAPHQVRISAEDELREIKSTAEEQTDDYVTIPMLASEILLQHNTLSHYTVTKIGKALTAMRAETTVLHGSKFYSFPCRKVCLLDTVFGKKKSKH